MTDIDELDSYRKLMTSITPENPRREIDIEASLKAFDAAQTRLKSRHWPDWLRLPVLIGGTATVAAGLVAVLYLPQGTQVPGIAPPAPPDLRLALPENPVNTAPSRVIDAQVLAAFSGGTPQYFPLPWDPARMLAVLGGVTAEAGETVLFAAEERRLVLLPRSARIAGPRAQDESYQRFAIALAGIALLASGNDLGAEWPADTLWAEARAAANANPAREAALVALAAP